MQKNNTNIKPDYQDDVMKYIYLALAMRNDGKFTYIYSLCLERDARGQYQFAPKTRIDTFRNTARAELAYATMQEIKRYQDKTFSDTFSGVFTDAIANFKKNIR